MLDGRDDDDKVRRRRSLPSSRRKSAILLLSFLAVVSVAWWLFASGTNAQDPTRYDAVIVPGGGLNAAAEPAEWVVARLDAALRHDTETNFFLVLSRGTTHKPPPLDGAGFPVDEAAASARYLVQHGVAPARILLESWSLDTIGNAAFARLMHADLCGWRHMLVVTSKFHRPRTEVIFDWVFGLPDGGGRLRRPPAQIVYEEVPERGLNAEQSATRQQKEAEAIDNLQQKTMASVRNLEELHRFIFVQHGAYRVVTADEAEARERERAQGALAKTY